MGFNFFDVFVKRTQHSNVALKDNTYVFDWGNELLVFNISLQDGIDDLEKTIVNHQLEAGVIFLYVFEDHEGNSDNLLSWNFL